VIFKSISNSAIARTRLTKYSTVIGTAINIKHLLVQESKDNGRLALVRDSGEGSVVALYLFTGVAKLTKLIGAHRVDETRRSEEKHVPFAAGHSVYESRFERS